MWLPPLICNYETRKAKISQCTYYSSRYNESIDDFIYFLFSFIAFQHHILLVLSRSASVRHGLQVEFIELNAIMEEAVNKSSSAAEKITSH